MNKFWLFVIGAAAVLVALSNLGSLIGLAISAAILYYTVKWFMKTDSLFKKMIWGSIAAVAGITAVANVPAILGLVALYVVYVIYKKWNEAPSEKHSKDPFASFEKQWQELKNKS
ncbi:lmo0954 family membrane protein [Jeotgalibacillus campisalis]|uniref:Flagellar basal body rod protein n=1 Tax=Jeotgalibacillus campisalis TaxID=220754 RepID=A0A0C2VRP4_9BACL|nr:hypothetical protein [Jeotgalibacillus campisalis]KIL47106.1 hypothetical protein KR50_24280 [Jeotgalibacillus campisalis]